MPLQPNPRLDHLDSVRSFALLLGIAFHTALSFMPIFIGWAVMDISTSDQIPSFILVAHSFRMPLFFLIAGYFSHMTLHKKGIKPFVQSRLIRVGIPLLIAWIVLKPLLISGWIMGAQSMRGDVNITNALTAGFANLGEFPQGFLIGTHLWFLYYLLLVSISVIALRFLVSLHAPTKSLLTRFADRVVGLMSRSSWMILLLAIPTALALWFMQHWGLDTPDKSLIPHIPLFCIYGGCFLVGWLFERDTSTLDSFIEISLAKLVLCVVSIIGAIYLSGFQSTFSHPNYSLLKASFMLSYALMMWTLISLSIGFSKKWLSRPNKLVRYIADASYWLYLVHLPIVIYLQIAFAELPLHWSIKLISIFVMTIGISLVIYDLLVRSTFIGATLNGKRKPRALFTKVQAKANTFT